MLFKPESYIMIKCGHNTKVVVKFWKLETMIFGWAVGVLSLNYMI